MNQENSDRKEKQQLDVIFSLVGVQYYSMIIVLGESIFPDGKTIFVYMIFTLWICYYSVVTGWLYQIFANVKKCQDFVLLVIFEILKPK